MLPNLPRSSSRSQHDCAAPRASPLPFRLSGLLDCTPYYRPQTPLRCRRMSDDVVSTFGVLRARTTTVQAPNPGASGMRAAVALLSPGRGIELHQTCRICILTVSHLTGLLCKDHSTSSYLDERQPDSRQVTRLQTSGQVAGALM